MVPDHYLNIFRLLPRENLGLLRLAARLMVVFHTCSCWQAPDGHLPEIPWGHECALQGNEICVGALKGNHKSLVSPAVTQLRRIRPLCEFFTVCFSWIVSLLYFPFIAKPCLLLFLGWQCSFLTVREYHQNLRITNGSVFLPISIKQSHIQLTCWIALYALLTQT